MEPVAEKQQTVIQGHSTDVLPATRQVKRTRVACVIVCLGVALMVAPVVWNLARGDEVGWDQAADNIGLALVVLGFCLSQLALGHSERKAQSALSRLDQVSRCERCGHDLTVEKCPACGYSRQRGGKEASKRPDKGQMGSEP